MSCTPDRHVITPEEFQEYAEMVRIVWPPRTTTQFHDHGNSRGLVQMRRGKLEEIRYPDEEAKKEERLVHRAGDFFLELPGVIHLVHNPFDEIAESLHIYIPPPLQMRMYVLNSAGGLQ